MNRIAAKSTVEAFRATRKQPTYGVFFKGGLCCGLAAHALHRRVLTETQLDRMSCNDYQTNVVILTMRLDLNVDYVEGFMRGWDGDIDRSFSIFGHEADGYTDGKAASIAVEEAL